MLSAMIKFWRLAFNIVMEDPSVMRVVVCVLSPLLSMVVIPVLVVRSFGMRPVIDRFDHVFWKLL